MEPEKKTSIQIASKNTDTVAYFGADESFSLVFKKTEKLASAIYLVTSLFSESEPMRWNLRKKISDLLSFNLSYKDTGDTNETFSYELKTRSLEIVSLLEVSAKGGLVSQMNASILRQEFDNLVSLVDSPRSAPGQTLGGAVAQIFTDSSPSPVRNTPLLTQSATQKITPRDETNEPKTGLSDIKDKPNYDSTIERDNNTKRSDRQTTILSVIRRKKEVTIKDIVTMIKDCSEKTVQRELNSLIGAGILKRAGVRRWSKYSLAQ